MRRQSGVQHALDGRMRLEMRCDSERVARVRLHAEVQRLEPTQRKVAVEGRRDATERILQKAEPREQLGVLNDDNSANDYS
jgi:hypothetical protein